MGLYDQLSNKAENDKMYVELDGTMGESGVPTMDFLNPVSLVIRKTSMSALRTG